MTVASQPEVVSSELVSDTQFAIIQDAQTGKFFVHKNEAVLLRTHDASEAQRFFDSAVKGFKFIIS